VRAALVYIILIISTAILSNAQSTPGLKGSVERIKVHCKSLEGNLSGDSADRFVSVYLPPSYKKNSKAHYPVVYFLHGFTDDDAKWYGLVKHWINLPLLMDSAIGKKGVNEMIVVTPNAYSRHQGSWYSNSATTGNWEDFITEELVSYIDAHYRTIAKATSRGIMGHSMGGYGAMRIGEKHPDVFSSVYLLSPATLRATITSVTPALLKADSITTIEEFRKADFGVKALYAQAAAWSPNPNRPPFYVDLPIRDGQLQTDILNKWAANMPLTTLDQYIRNLQKLKGLGFDAGTKDEAIAAGIRALDGELNKYGIPHQFEIYEGNHTNKIAERIMLKALPFFNTNLVFEKKR
jgi:S-formylglutathione hydrolase FrmB